MPDTGARGGGARRRSSGGGRGGAGGGVSGIIVFFFLKEACVDEQKRRLAPPRRLGCGRGKLRSCCPSCRGAPQRLGFKKQFLHPACARLFIDRLEVASCTPLSRDPTRTRNLRFAGASCQTQPAATRGVLSPIFRLLAGHRAVPVYTAGALSSRRAVSLTTRTGLVCWLEEGVRSLRAEMKTRFYLSFFLGLTRRADA